jgi:hypothetical protein
MAYAKNYAPPQIACVVDIDGKLTISQLLGLGVTIIKIVEDGNFTNTLSFTKLASMLNLKGNNNKSIANSYKKQKECGGLKFVKDYTIIYFCKSTKKFTVCSLTELPLDCIAVNPSNGIQTKIPNKTVVRTNFEKFELIHKLFIEYIDKRILNPAKTWETLING